MHEHQCTRTFQIVLILLYSIIARHSEGNASSFYCLFKNLIPAGLGYLQVGLDCAYKSSPLGSGLGFSTIIPKDMDGQPEF